MSECFTLGNKFNTLNVINMSHMFSECEMPEGFSLGDNFDTSNVKIVAFMFSGQYYKKLKIPKGFSFGNKFNISNVEDVCGMLNYCIIPDDFSFGNVLKEISAKKPEGSDEMFFDCKYESGKVIDNSIFQEQITDKNIGEEI